MEYETIINEQLDSMDLSELEKLTEGTTVTEIIDDLINAFTSIQLADWNDSVYGGFLSSIGESIQHISEYKESTNASNKCRLSIQLGGGIHEKTFTADEISPLGKTALSNLRSVFDEYNDALEPDEQLAILAKLIEEIIY